MSESTFRRLCETVIEDQPVSAAGIGAMLLLPWAVLIDVLVDALDPPDSGSYGVDDNDE